MNGRSLVIIGTHTGLSPFSRSSPQLVLTPASAEHLQSSSIRDRITPAALLRAHICDLPNRSLMFSNRTAVTSIHSGSVHWFKLLPARRRMRNHSLVSAAVHPHSPACILALKHAR